MNIVILRCLVAVSESLLGFTPGIYSYLRPSGAAECAPNRLLRKNSIEKCPKNPPTTHYSQRSITFAPETAQKIRRLRIVYNINPKVSLARFQQQLTILK